MTGTNTNKSFFLSITYPPILLVFSIQPGRDPEPWGILPKPERVAIFAGAKEKRSNAATPAALLHYPMAQSLSIGLVLDGLSGLLHVFTEAASGPASRKNGDGDTEQQRQRQCFCHDLHTC